MTLATVGILIAVLTFLCSFGSFLIDLIKFMRDSNNNNNSKANNNSNSYNS